MDITTARKLKNLSIERLSKLTGDHPVVLYTVESQWPYSAIAATRRVAEAMGLGLLYTAKGFKLSDHTMPPTNQVYTGIMAMRDKGYTSAQLAEHIGARLKPTRNILSRLPEPGRSKRRDVIAVLAALDIELYFPTGSRSVVVPAGSVPEYRPDVVDSHLIERKDLLTLRGIPASDVSDRTGSPYYVAQRFFSDMYDSTSMARVKSMAWALDCGFVIFGNGEVKALTDPEAYTHIRPANMPMDGKVADVIKDLNGSGDVVVVLPDGTVGYELEILV